MSVPWSRCGNYELHEPHHDQHGRDCPGWDLYDQVTRELITKVHEYLRENYADDSAFPAGLRLEMHPSVRRAMWLCQDLWDTYSAGLGKDPAERFPVPAKVTVDLPEGTWRLVIVEEEVLLTG